VFISSERLPPVAKPAPNLMVPRSAYGAALVLAILMIGFIAIVLTIISTAVELWLGLGFINTFNQQFNQQLNSNLNLYR